MSTDYYKSLISDEEVVAALLKDSKSKDSINENSNSSSKRLKPNLGFFHRTVSNLISTNTKIDSKQDSIKTVAKTIKFSAEESAKSKKAFSSDSEDEQKKVDRRRRKFIKFQTHFHNFEKIAFVKGQSLNTNCNIDNSGKSQSTQSGIPGQDNFSKNLNPGEKLDNEKDATSDTCSIISLSSDSSKDVDYFDKKSSPPNSGINKNNGNNGVICISSDENEDRSQQRKKRKREKRKHKKHKKSKRKK